MSHTVPLPELHHELTEAWRLLSLKISLLLTGNTLVQDGICCQTLAEAKQLRAQIQETLAQLETSLEKSDPLPIPENPVNVHTELLPHAHFSASASAPAATSVETAPPAPRTIKVTRLPENLCRPDIVLLTGSIFHMGDRQGIGSVDEQPLIEAAIKPFGIGRYPVTFDEYDRFIDDVNQAMPDTPFKKPKDIWGRGRQPVVNITWHEANIYAEWLSIQMGRKFRLPTEAEWEYAARAGIDNAWWFGDNECELGEYAWFHANAENQTHPVGRKSPNLWGIHDMYGNVWEWTASAYENKLSPQAARSVPRKNKHLSISLRGGSWGDSAQHTRASARNWLKPNAKNFTVGFRLVEVLETEDDYR